MNLFILWVWVFKELHCFTRWLKHYEVVVVMLSLYHSHPIRSIIVPITSLSVVQDEPGTASNLITSECLCALLESLLMMTNSTQELANKEQSHINHYCSIQKYKYWGCVIESLLKLLIWVSSRETRSTQSWLSADMALEENLLGLRCWNSHLTKEWVPFVLCEDQYENVGRRAKSANIGMKDSFQSNVLRFTQAVGLLR